MAVDGKDFSAFLYLRGVGVVSNEGHRDADHIESFFEKKIQDRDRIGAAVIDVAIFMEKDDVMARMVDDRDPPVIALEGMKDIDFTDKPVPEMDGQLIGRAEVRHFCIFLPEILLKVYLLFVVYLWMAGPSAVPPDVGSYLLS